MVDGKCKDCKYYEKMKDSEVRGYCNCEKYLYEGFGNGYDYEEMKKFDDTLHYWDYESYSAGFNVGENFGCIHFES